MSLSKLRPLYIAYHRRNVVQESIRKSVINLPAIAQSVRTFARKSFRGPTKNEDKSVSRINDDRPLLERLRNKSLVNPIEFQKLRPIRFKDLKEIKKNFYKPSEITKNRTKAEIAAFRSKNEIRVPSDALNPIFTFDELEHLPTIMAKKIRKFGEPTPIQAQGIPIALSGRNMVGIAQTGSGKTLAYIVPAIMHILNQPQLEIGNGPIALVVAPTRELAQQIQKVASEYGKSLNIQNAALYGGADKDHQLEDLQRGAELVVGTPGRLIDLLCSAKLNLRRCSYLVLDEADRMLDMGFEPQIRQIVSQIRPDRQTLMWSATWPYEVRDLAQDFLSNDFVPLTVGSLNLCANHNIRQVIKVCEENEKFDALLDTLKEINQLKASERKTLIFVQTKSLADELANNLKEIGMNAEAIHGDRKQNQREKLLNAFRKDRLDILIATDVASRGLDVKDIKHVINYDYPNTTEDYVHRIGRTGRSRSTGTAITFFTRDNGPQSADLIGVLEEANQEIPPKLIELSKIKYEKLRRTNQRKDYINY